MFQTVRYFRRNVYFLFALFRSLFAISQPEHQRLYDWLKPGSVTWV
jgi:hypothetical protein